MTPGQLAEGDEVIAEGDGCWLSYLKFGDEVVWRMDDPLPQFKEFGDLSSGDKILDSDT